VPKSSYRRQEGLQPAALAGSALKTNELPAYKPNSTNLYIIISGTDLVD
jgi:hypothetical protein